MVFLEQVGHIVASKDAKGLTSAAVSKLPVTQNLLPWTEKYKPKVANDIVGNQSLVCILNSFFLGGEGLYLYVISDNSRLNAGKTAS